MIETNKPVFLQKSICHTVGFILLLWVFSCSSANSSNQMQNLPSPDDNYTLSVPIIEKEDGSHYWLVTIKDKDENLVYQDPEGFFARFNVYWVWDEDNRVWLYNSDDGWIYYWQRMGNEWQKHRWNPDDPPEQVDLIPPEDLFPDYYQTGTSD